MDDTKQWEDIRTALVDILQNAKHYKSGRTDETCFLTAYQLAVLLYKNCKHLLKHSGCPQNIGGKGEGEYTSLAQYIANSLSRDIANNGVLSGIVELRFINTDGLEQFSFLDEKGIISQPSSKCFSMFRFIGN